MRNEQRNYEAPQLVERGDAVSATRIRRLLPFEPGTTVPQAGPGDVGFGL
ncbi:MAG TPA: hypothetical protein VF102_11245 [Gemmatimonadaceae bacterium]|jgi:hypothetical protein